MKKHMCLYKKMLAFALSFAMIAGVWGGIGINAKAEGRIIKEKDLKQGDYLYPGDTIEFELDDTIKIVGIYYHSDGEGANEGALASGDYSYGLRITLPELTYVRYGETKEYKYNVYQYTYSKSAWYDSTEWLCHINAVRYDENGSGSGENVPGGNTPGENTSGEELAENNPAKENSNVSSESTTSMTVNNVASHTCNFEWVITVDPTTGGDGLEEYICTGCGAVSQSHPIPASVAVIKDFYGNVKEAPENGNITYDSGKLYTISDYLLKKMAERNDVSVTVKFEYQNKKYQLTFPAGQDYSAVLTDEETMYGYFGVAAKLGLSAGEA